MGNKIDYRGGKIFFTQSGSGDVIVLLHGYLESSEIWIEFAERLSKKYRVVSIDLPGNGKSSLYSEEHTMCFMADAVLAVLESLDITYSIIIGHSLGGYVALSIVDRYPEKIRGYVLFHSHPFADSVEAKANRIREIDIILSGKKEVIYSINIPKMFATSNLESFRESIERSTQIVSEHEAEGIVSVLRGMMNRKSRDYVVESGKTPLLIILGRMDNYIDYESMKTRIKLPANGSIATLNMSGHLGFIEEPDRSHEIIEQFILGL